jgi:AcrR family transcriptional regulator
VESSLYAESVTGLRERKKNQTRQHIADTAVTLFVARGFDAVTVDEVAQAAEVSKKTVFNYFATKEDLVFSHLDERQAALVALVRDRPTGVSLVQAFRDETLQMLDHLGEHGSRRDVLLGLVRTSTSLQRRAHLMQAQFAQAIADELAVVTGAPESDPLPMAVAHMLLGAHRSVLLECHRRISSGAAPAEAGAALKPDVHRIFAVLENGLSDYAFTGADAPPEPDALDEVLWQLAGSEGKKRSGR